MIRFLANENFNGKSLRGTCASLPIGLVVADRLVILGASDMGDWDNLVSVLPL